MATLGPGYKVVVKDGKTVLEKKPKRYDLCTELKQKHSKKVRVKRKGT